MQVLALSSKGFTPRQQGADIQQQRWRGPAEGALSNRRFVASHAAAASSSSSGSMVEMAAPNTAHADDFASDTRPVILFDGVCVLCNAAVDFMLTYDPEAKFRLAALQSPAGRRLLEACGRRPDDISSIVLVEKGGVYHLKSSAVLNIAKGLSNPLEFLALFGMLVPPFLRDTAYDLVANNRYNILGKRDTCRMMDPKDRSRFIIE